MLVGRGGSVGEPFHSASHMIYEDPCMSRPVRAARAVAIIATWLIWISGVVLGLATHMSWLALAALILGFAPYIISIKRVEPWLMRRIVAKRHADT